MLESQSWPGIVTRILFPLSVAVIAPLTALEPTLADKAPVGASLATVCNSDEVAALFESVSVKLVLGKTLAGPVTVHAAPSTVKFTLTVFVEAESSSSK